MVQAGVPGRCRVIQDGRNNPRSSCLWPGLFDLPKRLRRACPKEDHFCAEGHVVWIIPAHAMALGAIAPAIQKRRQPCGHVGFVRMMDHDNPRHIKD